MVLFVVLLVDLVFGMLFTVGDSLAMKFENDSWLLSSSVNQGFSVWIFEGAAVNHKNEEVEVLVRFVVLLNVSLGRGVVQNKSEFGKFALLVVDFLSVDGVVLVVVEYNFLVVTCVDLLLGEYVLIVVVSGAIVDVVDVTVDDFNVLVFSSVCASMG